MAMAGSAPLVNKQELAWFWLGRPSLIRTGTPVQRVVQVWHGDQAMAVALTGPGGRTKKKRAALGEQRARWMVYNPCDNKQ
jgi:hypothetical protein